jgi:hypothetical protein
MTGHGMTRPSSYLARNLLKTILPKMIMLGKLDQGFSFQSGNGWTRDIRVETGGPC